MTAWTRNFSPAPQIKSYFLCNLGYGVPRQRAPARRAPGLRRSLQDPVKILAVDTALGACSVALLEDDKILAHIFEAMDRGHAERLAPMVEEAMQRAWISPRWTGWRSPPGPGTFTGQRVGLAFMRGLAPGAETSADRRHHTGSDRRRRDGRDRQTRAAAIHDARREEAYLLLQDGDDGGAAAGGDAVSPTPSNASALSGLARWRAPARPTRAGNAWAQAFTLSTIRQPDALWVARLAQKRPRFRRRARAALSARARCQIARW